MDRNTKAILLDEKIEGIDPNVLYILFQSSSGKFFKINHLSLTVSVTLQ